MEPMEVLTVITGVLSMLRYVSKIPSLDEWKRILEGEIDYLNAKMIDIKETISSTHPVGRSKKRKQDDDLSSWIDGGEKLVKKTQCLCKNIGSWRTYVLGAKMSWDAYKMFSALKRHDKRGDELLRQALSNPRGFCPAYHMPVKQIVGRGSSKTLHKIKKLLEDDKVGMIVIHGVHGIGKTFLMKHSHNWALDRFDCVVWVSSPDEFTIKSIQDAIASVVNCDISRDSDSNLRARILSQTLAGLGRFALFLDGVPEADFSLDDIGIPAEGSKCKLVLSTSANSNVVCRMLRSFKTVEVVPLRGKEAYQLFEQEARIGPGIVSSLGEMPRILADTRSGIPLKIVDLGTRMSGRDDPSEWRYELLQSGCLGRKHKLPIMSEPVRRSKRLKKEIVSSPVTLGKGETSSCVHRSG